MEDGQSQTTPEAATETEIYARRFDAQSRARTEMWAEICAYLQRYVPASSAILDIGAGDGEFISQIGAAERWASDIRDTSAGLPDDIRFVVSRGDALLDLLPGEHFDRVFMSNYLEHLPSPDAVIEQLRVVHGLLKPGGRAIILQPNIALVGAAYWDFIDHKVALTDRSLTEAVELVGLTPVVTIRRFLPYSTKGRLPTSARLVRLYLKVPLAWRFMGKQTLMIAERPAGSS